MQDRHCYGYSKNCNETIIYEKSFQIAQLVIICLQSGISSLLME